MSLESEIEDFISKNYTYRFSSLGVHHGNLREIIAKHASQQVNSADTENERRFDEGEYYIEYVSADVVHLRRCG